LTAVRQRELVVQAFPKADISRSLEAIGQRLTQGTNKTINKDGFLRKVANWFF